MYYVIPTDPAKSIPLLQRFMRENIATSSPNLPGRRRPLAPRGVTIAWNANQFTLNWVGPQNMSGVLGFNIYQNNENNRIQNLADSENLSTQVVMPAGFTGKAGFYVSCYTAILESVKVPIVGATS